MANTLISYNGIDCYYNNYNTSAPFIKTKANNIYLNENCYMMFSNCSILSEQSFNDFFNVVKLDHVRNCQLMFNRCDYFNHNIQIPANVTDCTMMFSDCRRLNQNIQIPANVTNCANMFFHCDNLNQNIQIPANVTSCYYMFTYCYNLNQNIQIPANVTNCFFMFLQCFNLNQNIQIPAKATNCAYMFASCYNLNQNIQIPANVTNCAYMFRDCNKIGGSGRSINININTSQTVHNFYSFVRNKNNSKRLNIYCNNLALLNNRFANGSIVGKNIMWSSTTNGYFNSGYNIYLYNNYTGNT